MTILFIIGILLNFGLAQTYPWHHPMNMANNDYWRKRVKVEVRNVDQIPINDTVKLCIPIGNVAGMANIIGSNAKTVRLMWADFGLEMIYGIYKTENQKLVIQREGEIVPNSHIVFHFYRRPGYHLQYTFYIYADNPSAGYVADHVLSPNDNDTHLPVTVAKPEFLNLSEDDNKTWYTGVNENGTWHYRVPIKIINTEDRVYSDQLTTVNLMRFVRWLPGRFNINSARLFDGVRLIPMCQVDQLTAFFTDINAKTAKTVYLYLSEDKSIPQNPNAALTIDQFYLKTERLNLVRDYSFEAGFSPTMNWVVTNPANISLTIPNTGKLGTHSFKISVPRNVNPSWSGVTQVVPVTAGKRYFASVYMKGEQSPSGTSIIVQMWNDQTWPNNEQFSLGKCYAGTSDWTIGSRVFGVPYNVNNFRFCLSTAMVNKDSDFSLYYDGVLLSETMCAEPGNLQVKTDLEPASMALWSGNPIERIFMDNPPPFNLPRSASATAAKNEKEVFQIVLRTGNSTSGQYTVTVDPFIHTQNSAVALPAAAASIVGYVPIDSRTEGLTFSSQLTKYERRFPGAFDMTVVPPSLIAGNDGWPGLWPDPLYPVSQWSIKPNTTQPIWITVSAPADALPGEYTSTVKVACNGAQASMQLRLNVWDFSLPQKNSLAGMQSIATPDWIMDALQNDANRTDYIKKLCVLLKDNKMQPISIPYVTHSTGTVVPELKPVYNTVTQECKTDYTAFDAYAAYLFDECKVPQLLTSCRYNFMLGGWKEEPTFYVQAVSSATDPGTSVALPLSDGMFQTVFTKCLVHFWNHLKEKGWQDKFILYLYDEPFLYAKSPSSSLEVKTQLLQVLNMVKQAGAQVNFEIPSYISIRYFDADLIPYLKVWGMETSGQWPWATQDKLAILKTQDRTLMYTLDGQYTLDTPFHGAERMIPYFCYKFGFSGFEHYCFDAPDYYPFHCAWQAPTYDTKPESGSNFRWANDDDHLVYFYPDLSNGVKILTSTRVEQIREGMEDYEYMHILQTYVDAATSSQLKPQIQAVLEQVKSLVRFPNYGAQNSTWVFSNVAADMANVFLLKEQMGQLIQQVNWKAGVSYTSGDKVYYNDKIWLCKLSHTSQAGWEPGSPGTENLWEFLE